MKIHVRRDGRQFGPYSEQSIQMQLAQGTLLPTDLVWQEGWNDWIPLKDFPDVQAVTVPPEAPEPPTVGTPWLGAGIIGVSLCVILLVGFLIRTHLNAVDAGDSLKTTPTLLDANGATNIPTTTAPDFLPSQMNSNDNQTAVTLINPKLKEAQPLDGSPSSPSLDTINATLQSNPKNLDAYLDRGAIYSQKKLWVQAENDYKTILQLDSNNFIAKFNLAEIKFQQKEYADARPGFIALQDNTDHGDLAKYKVFLCDLFNGNEAMAAKELDAFNLIGANASYYFGNAAWDLYHKKPEDARGWLASAIRIYTPKKCSLYAASLQDLGYLPLPPPAK